MRHLSYYETVVPNTADLEAKARAIEEVQVAGPALTAPTPEQSEIDGLRAADC